MWEELKPLVDEWLSVERNWERFIKRRLKAEKPLPFMEGRFDIFRWGKTPSMRYDAGGNYAQSAFVQLAFDPEAWRLGGPCRREGCRRYFLRKKRSDEKIYCSRRCASGNSAAESMRNKRLAIHEALVELAKTAIKKWEREPDVRVLFVQNYGSGAAWDAWVAGEVTDQACIRGLIVLDEDDDEDTGITARQIRGWVKKDELKPPVERKLNRG
jgi:hypothetical protein